MGEPADPFDLDAAVRKADPDRWLSSRFVADPAARADLIALYAFEAELAAIPAKAAQPLLAEMRFTWWAEQMDGVFAGAPRKGHPVLEALAGAVTRRALSREPVDALIEAHVAAVHGEPADADALYARPMKMSVQLLAGANRDDAAAGAAGMWSLIRQGRGAEAGALRPAANRALRNLPAGAFPAVAHACLTAPMLSPLGRRARLFWAVLRGRV